MFEDDERFKAVEREADREDLFRNYLVDLQKKVSCCNCHFCKCTQYASPRFLKQDMNHIKFVQVDDCIVAK